MKITYHIEENVLKFIGAQKVKPKQDVKNVRSVYRRHAGVGVKI